MPLIVIHKFRGVIATMQNVGVSGNSLFRFSGLAATDKNLYGDAIAEPTCKLRSPRQQRLECVSAKLVYNDEG